jgi:thioredoxin 1
VSTTLIIVLIVVFLFISWIIFAYRRIKNVPDVADSPRIKVLTDKNFHNQIKSGTTLVDFWASWCLPCKMMAPVINEIAEEISGKAFVGKLNVEHHKVIAAKYNIRNIPTMILFREGKEVERFVGAKNKNFLLKQINQNC